MLTFKNPKGALVFRGALPQPSFPVHGRPFSSQQFLTRRRLGRQRLPCRRPPAALAGPM